MITLSKRMKEYEKTSRIYLLKKIPVIIRIDGKAFHTFTKGFDYPIDYILKDTMHETAKLLCQNIQNCIFAYVQSDEISLFLKDYSNIDTCAWFENNIQKMASISSSMATLYFNSSLPNILEKYKDNLSEEKINFYKSKINKALFDSRVFNIPKNEVCNYFIFRQQDCIRNSIQMFGRNYFKQNEIQGKNCNDIIKMTKDKYNVNFKELPTLQQRGIIVYNNKYIKKIYKSEWIFDTNIPLFVEDKDYISKFI